MILHEKSHVDHAITPDQWAFILENFTHRSMFFIETIELPEQLGTVMNGLYGPSCGDAPVPESEVYYAKRGDRAWDSRMTKMPPRPTRFVRVIAGPHEETCPHCMNGKLLTPQEMVQYNASEDDALLWCSKCDGTSKIKYDCILYTAYGVSSPDMPAAPKEPGDLKKQIAEITPRYEQGRETNMIDPEDHEKLHKLHAQLRDAEAFWAQHALAVEVP